MNITRNKYVEALKNRMNNGLVKVITGVRRCGKSYLLFELFCDFLIKSGIEENCIIKIALDDDINESLREPKKTFRVHPFFGKKF